MKNCHAKVKSSFIVFVVIPAFSFSVLSLQLFVKQANAATGINNQINFQGKLVDANGLNVADGSYTVVFSLYSVSSGGTAIWTETQSVTTSGGIFQVQLGSVTTLPGSVDFNTDSIYLGIKVGSDAEMTPRIRFAAVPYAFNAQKVAGLTVTNTTGTLTIPNGKTISFGDTFTTSGSNALTLTTTGTTNVTLPTTGTLITNTASANQTITTSQTSGTGLTIADSTGLTNAITGEAITLSGTGAFDQTGLSFNLSGATGANLNDIVGSGSSWKVSKNGAMTIAGLDLRGTNGTTAEASISGKTSFASLVIDQSGIGDILTASSSGLTRFRMANNGSTLFQGDTLSSIGTLGSSGTPSQTNDYAVTNAIGDQGSLIPNSGFESNLTVTKTSNTLEPNVSDGWVSAATMSASVVRIATDSAKGASSLMVKLNANESTAVYSACVPMALGNANLGTYNLMYYAKGSSAVPVVRGYLDGYTTKANCQSNTSPVFSAAQGAAITTAWAKYGGTSTISNLTNATWTRAHIFVGCVPGCTTGTIVNLDGVRVIESSLTGGVDYAENYPVGPTDKPEAGDVVSIQASGSASIVSKSHHYMDQSVIGVVSTNPGELLDDGTMGENKVPVALAGRIPTNVSTKNGPIHIGDYLTSSDISGVAVKAISAGQVIGQAMQEDTESDPTKVSKVIMFVKNTYYNGTSLASTSGLTIDQTTQDDSKNDATMQLDADGNFVLRDATGAATMHFATGDTASVVGQQGLTFSLTSLKAHDLASVSASTSAMIASSSASVLADATNSALLLPQQLKAIHGVLSVAGLAIDQDATVSGSLRVHGSGLVEGIFTIVDTLTTKDLIVNQLATFFGNVVFNGNVHFTDTPTFNADTAGYTTIQKGSDHADVQFIKEYATEPVINATLIAPVLTDETFNKYRTDGTCSDDRDACQNKLDRTLIDTQSKFLITHPSTKGFEIQLQQNADQDMRFSWSALSVKNDEAKALPTGRQEGGE